jgi:hypothetical protein
MRDFEVLADIMLKGCDAMLSLTHLPTSLKNLLSPGSNNSQFKHFPFVGTPRLVFLHLICKFLTFWHRSFIFNSNKSPTWCNNFSVYCPDVCLQLNMFRAFSRPSSGAQWVQWEPLVLPSYRGDSRAVFGVGSGRPAGRPDPEHSTTITTIRR